VSTAALQATSSRHGDSLPTRVSRGSLQRARSGNGKSIGKRERDTINERAHAHDSLAAIQVVLLAQESGYSLRPEQLLQYPTIAELAASAPTMPPARAEQGLLQGEVPLTAPQLYLLEHADDPRKFCTILTLRPRERLAAPLLARAVEYVVRQHDALRLRTDCDGRRWVQRHLGVDEMLPAFRRGTPADGSDVVAVQDAISEAADAFLQPGSPGIAVRVAGAGRDVEALVVALHFLVSDAVSWRLVLEDLDRACRQLGEGRPIQLPAKTSSYRDWAEARLRLADASETLEDSAYWLGLPWSGAAPVVLDGAGGDRETQGSRATLRVTLATDETASLLRAARTRQVPVSELVLAAVIAALRGRSPGDCLAMMITGHGRETSGDLDLSRTAGCFVNAYPVVFEIPRAVDVAQVATAVHGCLRSVPRGGRSFGLLRYLGRSARAESIRELPIPDASFNYRGRFATPDESWLSLAGTAEEAIIERLPARHSLEISAAIVGGRLGVDWEFGEAPHRGAMVEALVPEFLAAMRKLLPDGSSAWISARATVQPVTSASESARAERELRP
jgi:non-ribosomal peptide synthase protein (TIGR01720 family)